MPATASCGLNWARGADDGEHQVGVLRRLQRIDGGGHALGLRAGQRQVQQPAVVRDAGGSSFAAAAASGARASIPATPRQSTAMAPPPPVVVVTLTARWLRAGGWRPIDQRRQLDQRFRAW